MRKTIAALLAVLCVIAGGLLYWINKQEDVVPPLIEFPTAAELIYQEGGNFDILYEGVTAYDNVDGDVSDTLMVESVLPMKDESKATVLYCAKDKSNNVAKATRIVEYRPKDGIAWMMGADLLAEKEAKERESGLAEMENLEEGYEDIEDLPADYPRIYLKTHKVTVKYGEQYNLLSYVKDITDDKDGPDWLYYQIHIAGMADINGPGTYELYYSVIDREYHTSNKAKLTLVIEG